MNVEGKQPFVPDDADERLLFFGLSQFGLRQ